MYEFKQFKLNSGEEIICEVVEWAEENYHEIIVRDVMAIAPSVSLEGNKYYVFKPWMHYIESKEELVIINSSHIVSTGNPNPLLLEQYQKACVEMHMTATDRKNEYKFNVSQKYDELTRSLMGLLEEQMDEFTFKDDDDSDGGSNIIPFPVH